MRRALGEAGPGPHLVVSGDLTRPEGMGALFARTVAELGGVDLLVNNLGGSGARQF